MTKRIAIIGDGNVGSALRNGLENAGYDVRAVGKQPDKVAEVANWGELVVLAVPYTERHNAVREMGDGVRDKVLVDVTNAVGDDGYLGDWHQSGAEELQSKYPNLKVVKAFNTVFAENMAQGRIEGEALTLFAASDDQPSKKKVFEIAKRLGYDAVDAGPLRNARWLEGLGFFNIQLAFAQENGTRTGFRYIHPGGVRLSPQQA